MGKEIENINKKFYTWKSWLIYLTFDYIVSNILIIKINELIKFDLFNI